MARSSVAPPRRQSRAAKEPAGSAPGSAASGLWTSATGRGVFLFLLVFLAYIPAMRSGFIWDDDTFLYENKLIHASDGLRRFWFATEAPDYFPLTSTTLWLEWRLFGMNATGYHVINVLLHGVTSLLMWRILERLRVPGAWLAAAVFALHPVNVESVAWITERKNTLSMAFYAASLLLFLRFEKEERGRWYALALGAFLLALLAKTSVVMLPVVLLGLAWWQRGRIAAVDLKRVLPFFAVAGLLALVTIWFQYNRAIATDVVRDDSLPARLAGAGWVTWFYLYKALVPVNLSFVYPRWTINPSSLVTWVPLAALAAVFALAWLKRRTWGRPVLAGFGYFVVCLFPVMGFFNIYFMNYSLVADHWQYVSLPGVVALVIGGAASLAAGGREGLYAAARPAAAVLIAVLFGLTWAQQGGYRNEEALWHDTLSKNPGARLAHNNLATHYERLGDFARAHHHITRALEARPDDPTGHYNLGNILDKMDEAEKALAAYRQAVRLKPDHAEAYNNMANVLLRTGRPGEAETAVREALRLDPQYPEAHYTLGNVQGELGRTGEAEASYRAALGLRPGYSEAANNLGNLLLKQGRVAEAAEAFRKAVEANPEDLFAQFNYAVVLEKQGRPGEAVRHLEQALRINPGWPPAVERLQRLGRP